MATRSKKEADDDPESSARARSSPPRAEPKSPPAKEKAQKPASQGREARKPVPRAPEEVDRRGALAALSAGLEEIVPGIEVLDRDLVFDEGGRADLAAVDPSGRLYLVLLADGENDRIVLDALDAYAFAEANRELLARHLRRPRIALRDTQVIVICLEADDRLLSRLRPLLAHGIGLFRVRMLKSASGEHSYLVPWGAPERDVRGRGGVDAFLERLPAGLLPLTRTLIERMQRLDAELEPGAEGEALVWRAGGEVVVRVTSRGDMLQAQVTPEDHGRRLRSEDDLEDLTERTLERLLEVWGTNGNGHGEPGEEPVGADPVPQEGLPILSPEEIEAFRD